MNYKGLLTRLYFLLIYADGKVNDRELTSAKQMIIAEGIDEDEFNVQLQLLKTKDQVALLSECINGMKTLDRGLQIRIVAWLCVLANADGFMDRTEWQLIYRLYHKELALPLNEIFAVQKDLNRIVWLTPSGASTTIL